MSYLSFNSYRDNSTKRVRGLKMSVLIMRENMLFYEEIYTAGKTNQTANGSADLDKSHL